MNLHDFEHEQQAICADHFRPHNDTMNAILRLFKPSHQRQIVSRLGALILVASVVYGILITAGSAALISSIAFEYLLGAENATLLTMSILALAIAPLLSLLLKNGVCAVISSKLKFECNAAHLSHCLAALLMHGMTFIIAVAYGQTTESMLLIPFLICNTYATGLLIGVTSFVALVVHDEWLPDEERW